MGVSAILGYPLSSGIPSGDVPDFSVAGPVTCRLLPLSFSLLTPVPSSDPDSSNSHSASRQSAPLRRSNWGTNAGTCLQRRPGRSSGAAVRQKNGFISHPADLCGQLCWSGSSGSMG